MNTLKILLTGCLVLAPASALAQEDEVKLDEETLKAIELSLDWLKDRQNPDGSWGDSQYPHNTAITSFALLAFMSQGHLPNQGKYGPEVAKGARYLLASARESDGYLIGRNGNMYCHGMATLALSQLYGMTQDEELLETLERAVQLIVRTQNREGGWRYNPQPADADISVTIMQVMALRGAKNSGLHVPDRVMDRALAYIDSCYHPKSGGYGYQPNGSPGFARTAAGICVTKLTGEYERDVEKSVEYLQDHMTDREFYFYGQYYAAHAMYQVGGEPWREYYEAIKTRLLLFQDPKTGEFRNERRNEEGHNEQLDDRSAGPVYQTAISVIILSVPSHYLPIFQR